jgi:hypothetical protein
MHVSLELHGHARPSGDAIACHHCDVPLCVNPDHLYWGTHSTNMADAYDRGRMVAPPHILAKAARQRAQTHCKYGHELTPENIYWSAKGRSCRTCVLIRSSARQKRLRALAGPKPRRVYTHCKRGHELTPENTTSGIRRRCLTCFRMYQARHQAKCHQVLTNAPDVRGV